MPWKFPQLPTNLPKMWGSIVEILKADGFFKNGL